MQFGIFTVGDVTADPTTGRVPTEHERIMAMTAIARKAEEAGLDVFATGEHHNPPFVPSSPTAQTPLTVGSPQEVIDKTLTFRESFGDYQRQLFLMDHAGLPLGKVLDQLELLGGEVVPVLRKEIAARQDPQTPAAPTHESLVKAKYGEQPARQPRPNANRGDNVTGGSPYQDSAEAFRASYPTP